MFEEVIDKETMQMLGELKSVVLFILIVIDLVFIFLSTIYSFNFKVENLFADYDFLVCLLLFIDISYDYYNYKGSLKEFLIDDKNILALISLFPFDLLFRYFSIFRLFKFVRIIKIVRIYNLKDDVGSFIYFIQHHLFKLLLMVLIIYTTIASVLLIVLDDSISTVGDAVWFMIVTASTVGYGDVVPMSPIGKSLAILTIFMGIIFVAILTAYLSAIYNIDQEERTRKTVSKHVKIIRARNDLMEEEISKINDRLNKLEDDNKNFNTQLDSMQEKLDKILEKMDE